MRSPKKARRVRSSSGTRLRVESLEPRRLLAADPFITEFQASNNGTVLDGYGASSDWVEVFNGGDASVDLVNYILTDDEDFQSEGTGWRFPSITLDPGEYLIVFASGLDTVDPAGNLHTDFGLSSEGDYLALANPLGVVLSEFGPAGEEYPAQGTNESYGIGFDSVFSDVVTPSSPVTYLIPTDGSVDATWTGVGFDDSTWQTGLAALGYEQTETLYDPWIDTVVPDGTEAVYVRIPFNVTDPDAVMGTLRMKYDDGFVAYLNGTPIAGDNTVASPVFDSSATEFRPKEAAIEDAVFNVSAHSNLLQVGANVLSIHLMESPDSPSSDLLLSPTLTIGSGDLASPEQVGSLISPTPGLPNTNVVAGSVSFSHVGGVFDGSFDLTLTPTEPGELIRYTLDGSEPDTGSPVYAGPITIDATTRVRARAYGSDGRVGRVVSTSYTLAAPSITDFTSDLPIVVVENYGEGFPGREFEDATLSLYETDTVSGRSSLGETADLVSSVGHHRRGSSTFNQPKPNLRIEFRDEAGEDKDVELLGMPEESDWILYAPHNTDRSMIRNTVMYDLAGQLGRYSIRTRYVEVYFNSDDGVLDANDYMGVYVLMENIKRGESRIDIDSLSPSDTGGADITGGYILKVDRNDEEEDADWDTSQTTGPSRFVHVEPNRSEMTADQVDYIRGYVQDFENALSGPNSADPELGYAAYIDVDSWVDHHLFRVFSRETDVIVLSEHLHKPREGKLTFGPVWDFDRSAGSEGAANKGVEGWKGNVVSVFLYGWWDDLFDDPNFRQKWADRWQELRSSTYSDANLIATVQRQSEPLLEAQQRNAERWPDTAPNGGDFAEEGLVGWEAEISHLEGWLTARAAWIDDQMLAVPTLTIEDTANEGEGLLTLTTDSVGSDIYYTVDGTDPRASGGGVAPGAVLYTGPVVLTGTTTVIARTSGTGGFAPWSGATEGLLQSGALADATNLRVSELHYNPLDPTAAELSVVPDADNNSFEFVELINVGEETIDLTGVRFTDGVTFDFSTGNIATLAPGETVLVVQDEAAFEARYGSGLPVAGEYEGRFSGGGENVTIEDASDNVIQDFEYDDDSPWPEEADGDGPSIEVIDLLGDVTLGSNWRASVNDDGTPGSAVGPLLGDYDRNGVVDNLDHTAWVSQYGITVSAPGVGADGTRDGVVDAADYTFWRDRLGATLAVALATENTATPAAGEQRLEASESEVPVTVEEPEALGALRIAFASYGPREDGPEGPETRRGRPAARESFANDLALLLLEQSAPATGDTAGLEPDTSSAALSDEASDENAPTLVSERRSVFKRVSN